MSDTINIKESLLEVVNKHNLEILEINLYNDEVIGKEKGVYEAHKNINGTYSPVIPFPTNEKAFNDFMYHIEYFTGNKYLVTGDLLDETGTNDEPLIKNVKILKKL